MMAEDTNLVSILKDWMSSEFSHVHERLGSHENEFAALRDENRTQHREVREDFNRLRESVLPVLETVQDVKQRQDVHDEWHGPHDSAISDRLKKIEERGEHEELKQKAVADYKARWRWVGNLGIDALKGVGALVGSAILLGLGYLIGILV